MKRKIISSVTVLEKSDIQKKQEFSGIKKKETVSFYKITLQCFSLFILSVFAIAFCEGDISKVIPILAIYNLMRIMILSNLSSFLCFFDYSFPYYSFQALGYSVQPLSCLYLFIRAFQVISSSIRAVDNSHTLIAIKFLYCIGTTPLNSRCLFNKTNWEVF